MLEALMDHRTTFDVDLDKFRDDVDQVLLTQQVIFDIFDRVARDDLDSRAEQTLLNEAAVSMASMDRRTAAALDDLSVVERMLIREQNRLHEAYGRNLERRAITQRYYLLLSGRWYRSEGVVGELT